MDAHAQDLHSLPVACRMYTSRALRWLAVKVDDSPLVFPADALPAPVDGRLCWAGCLRRLGWSGVRLGCRRSWHRLGWGDAGERRAGPVWRIRRGGLPPLGKKMVYPLLRRWHSHE